MAAMAKSLAACSAHVVRVNPQLAPSKQRVLIELSGTMAQHEPMIADDFQPVGTRAIA